MHFIHIGAQSKVRQLWATYISYDQLYTYGFSDEVTIDTSLSVHFRYILYTVKILKLSISHLFVAWFGLPLIIGKLNRQMFAWWTQSYNKLVKVLSYIFSNS